jgi:hypothetical protein
VVTAGLLALVSSVLFVPAQAASPPLEPGNSTGDDPDEEWWVGITFPTDGVLPEDEVHPRLLLSEEDLAVVRERVDGTAADPHGHYAMAWDRLISDADEYVADGPADGSEDVRTKAAKATAFAWLVTQDDRYLDAAVANLEDAFEDLVPTDQYVATQMTNYALAYDWVAADLTPDQDDAIRTSIKRGATWLYEYLDRPGVRSHNHRSKAGAALGTWALAFPGDADAQAFLDRGLENMERVFSYMFTEDGIYRDGSGYYWIFTIMNSTPFLWAYRNVSGVDLFPAMQPAFEWQLKTANPKGWMPPLDDGWYKPTWLHTVAGAYADTPTELSSDGTLGELFQWQFFATDLNPVRYPDDWTGARDQFYGWPEEIVLYDSTIAEVQPDGIPTIDMNAGPRGGDTIFRSDWNYADPRTRWGYFGGAAMSNNHDHADGLQLLIDAENAILARDNGYGPRRFSGRDEWTGPEHHNVVTADGAAVGDPTPTRGFLSGSTFGFAEKSAAYWNDQDADHTRAVAFPASDYFVVLDRLRAAESKQWDAYWHVRGEVSGAANRRTWTTADGPWGEPAQLHALVVSEASMSLVDDQFNPFGTGVDTGFEGYPDPATDVEDIEGLRARQEGTSAELLSVLVPSAVGNGPRLEDLGTEARLAARVTFQDHTDLVVAPRADGDAAVDRFAVEGDLGWIRLAGDVVDSLAMHDGTGLSWDESSIVTTTAPVTLSVDLADPAEHVVEIAENEESYELTLAAAPSRPVTGVTFNGTAIDFDADRHVRVELAGGGELVVTYGAADTAPDTPGGLATRGFDGLIELTWNAVLSASEYQVLRDGVLIATVPGNRFGDDDVVNLRPHKYQVVAVNDAGESPATRGVTGMARVSRPEAPSGLVASVAHGRVELGWLPVRDADSYDVYRGVPGSDLERIAVGLAGTELIDTDVTNGQSYRYAVRARGVRGVSGLSTEVTAQPQATPPAVPAGLRTDRDAESVTLRWDQAEFAASYEVLRGELTSENLEVVATDVTEPTWTDASAAVGLGYTYEVRARNDGGVSASSNRATAVPGCSLTYPVDPATGAVIEAELYSAVSGEYGDVEDLDRFGGRVSAIPRGAEYKENPDLWGRYDLEVEEAGTYFVQVLGHGFDGSSDSVFVSVDDGRNTTFNLSVGEWSYRQSAIGFELGGGFHTLLVKAREDGALVDRVVVYPASSIPNSVRFAEAWTVPRTPECGSGTGEPAAPEPVSSVRVQKVDDTDVVTWPVSRLAESYTVWLDGVAVAENVTTNSWTGPRTTDGSYAVIAENAVGRS